EGKAAAEEEDDAPIDPDGLIPCKGCLTALAGQEKEKRGREDGDDGFGEMATKGLEPGVVCPEEELSKAGDQPEDDGDGERDGGADLPACPAAELRFLPGDKVAEVSGALSNLRTGPVQEIKHPPKRDKHRDKDRCANEHPCQE